MYKVIGVLVVSGFAMYGLYALWQKCKHEEENARESNSIRGEG